MNNGNYVFSQLIKLPLQNAFQRIIMKYQGDKYIKSFSCWNQLLVMMFGQLSGYVSLRELVCITTAHSSKSCHLGFGKRMITCSYIAKAMANRDSKIYKEFTYKMIAIAQSNCAYTYLTNCFTSKAKHIASFDKSRWHIDLFKCLKQDLLVKSFWGINVNPVRIQIYSAITAYCLVAIFEHDLFLNRSTFDVLIILNMSLFYKSPKRKLFKRNEPVCGILNDNHLQFIFNF